MLAFTYPRYGGIEALQLLEVEKPVPGDNEVLVKVKAVAINDWDWSMMDGKSVFNRLFSGFSKPKHKILGSDIAGHIEAVGKNVQQFKPGDEVYGDLSGRWGGFAEYTCAPAKSLARKPATMTFEEAASIPQAAMLAYQGLVDKGKIQAGQTILINGAGGGVGTFGIQIANLYGVEITVVDSPGKFEMLRNLGAAHTIDFTKEDFTKSGKRYDLILDAKTNRPLSHYLRVLKPGGMYVTVGGSMSRLLQCFLSAPFVSFFTSKKTGIVALRPNKDLDFMNELFLSGKLRPVIDGYYELTDLPKAMQLFSRADHKGKLVISVKSR